MTNFIHPSAFVMGLGTLGPAIAVGLIGYAACLGISRNPEAASKIQTLSIVLVAFAEAIAIYALIIAFILKFVP